MLIIPSCLQLVFTMITCNQRVEIRNFEVSYKRVYHHRRPKQKLELQLQTFWEQNKCRCLKSFEIWNQAGRARSVVCGKNHASVLFDLPIAKCESALGKHVYKLFNKAVCTSRHHPSDKIVSECRRQTASRKSTLIWIIQTIIKRTSSNKFLSQILDTIEQESHLGIRNS